MRPRAVGLLPTLLIGLGLTAAALAEETGPCMAEPATELPACEREAVPRVASVEPDPSEESSPNGTPGVLGALLGEAKRYVKDTGAFFTAPVHWNASDVRKAAGFGAILTTLFFLDEPIYEAVQRNKSRFTDKVSGATSSLGQQYAWYFSGALLAGGLALRQPGLRDTGRDALEALVLSGLIADVLKPILGRERPYQANGETVFHAFNQHFQSYPSGHATTAFALASVVAMRADGWIIPSLAYATAFTVALDRINDTKHYASDVFTGAAIGVVTGRFIVNRHRELRDESGKLFVELLPVRDGISARLRF